MSYTAPNGTLVASAAYTTTQSGTPSNFNLNYRGVVVVFDVTVLTAGASLVVTIETYDPASAKWVALLTGAAVTSVSTNIYKVHPLMTAVSNVTANQMLPPQWRATVTPADTKSVTYSVGYIHLN